MTDKLLSYTVYANMERLSYQVAEDTESWMQSQQRLLYEDKPVVRDNKSIRNRVRVSGASLQTLYVPIDMVRYGIRLPKRPDPRTLNVMIHGGDRLFAHHPCWADGMLWLSKVYRSNDSSSEFDSFSFRVRFMEKAWIDHAKEGL